MAPSAGSQRVRSCLPRGRAGLGAEACRDPDILAGYLRDASGEVGRAEALYRPESEADLAAILASADRVGTPVTVVAGQTSTTASSVPSGGWVVSTERLTRRLGTAVVEPSGRHAVASAEAGIGLGAFQAQLEREGWLYPPDPTSRHECSLGGSVACNASGARSFAYGATRRWIRGLRVVLASGEVLALRRGQVVSTPEQDFALSLAAGEVSVPVPRYATPECSKHAGGYATGPELDLVDLFIGSEGTLGAISEVEVALVPRPERVLALLAFFPDEAAALRLVERARDPVRRGEGIAPRCLEWLDAASLDLARTRVPELAIPDIARVAVYVEQESSSGSVSDAADAWYALLAACGALVEHPAGVLVADDAAGQERFRAARHAVPVGVNERAAARGMPKVGTDLAVPDARLREMLALYRTAARDPWSLLDEEALAQLPADAPRQLETVTFGHAGDNHLHVNFLPETPAGLALARAVYAELTIRAIAMGGTPSAEHGIGKIKWEGLRALVGDAGIESMRAVKRALDPQGVLGPGNLFPAAP